SIAVTLSRLTRARGWANVLAGASRMASSRVWRSVVAPLDLRTQGLQLMHGFGARRHARQSRHQRADDFGVVFSAGTAPQFAQRLLGRSRGSTGASARDGVGGVPDVRA